MPTHFTIVGVVRGVKQRASPKTKPKVAATYPYPFHIDCAFFVVARTSQPPESYALTLQKVVATLTPTCRSVTSARWTLAFADSLVAHRYTCVLRGLFSA